MRESYVERVGIDLGFKGRPRFAEEWVFPLDSKSLLQMWT